MKYAPAFLALCMAACAQVPATSQPGFYRPKGTDDQTTITASAERAGRFGSTYNISILIDGKPAAAGTLTGNLGTASGTWQGRSVEADCTAGGADPGIIDSARAVIAGMDTNTIRCLVFVGGERAAVLVMSPK